MRQRFHLTLGRLALILSLFCWPGLSAQALRIAEIGRPVTSISPELNEWLMSPVTMEITIQFGAKAEADSAVYLFFAGTNAVTLTGAGCNVLTNAAPFVVEVTPEALYELRVIGAELSDVRLQISRPAQPLNFEKTGDAAHFPTPHIVHINGEEREVIDFTNPVQCGNLDRKWFLKLKRDDRRKKRVINEEMEDVAPGDGRWLRMGPGKHSQPEIGALEWSVGVGRLPNGKSAGRIWLKERQITTDLYHPGSLFFTEPSSNQFHHHLIQNNGIRQIKVPQCLVNVVTNTNYFDLEFYVPEDVSEEVDLISGLYTITNTASPYVTWQLGNPDATLVTSNSFYIAELRNGLVYSNYVTFDSTNKLWTLLRGAGAEARKETRAIYFAPITEDRYETNEVRNASNTVVYKSLEHYHQFDWGWEVLSVVSDPDGAALTQTFAYYDDPDDTHNYGNLKHIHYPDGSWEKRLYLFGFVLKEVLRPFRDWPQIPDHAHIGNAHRTTYAFNFNTNGVLLSQGALYQLGIISPEARPYSEDWTKTDYSVGNSEGRFSRHYDRILSFAWQRPQQDDPLWSELPTAHIKTSGPQSSIYYDTGVYNLTNLTFTVNTNEFDFRISTLTGFDNENYWLYGIPPYLPDNDFATATNLVSGVTTAGVLSTSSFSGTNDGYALVPLYMVPGQSHRVQTIMQRGAVMQEDTAVYAELTTPELVERKVYVRDSQGRVREIRRVDARTGVERLLYQADWFGADSKDGGLKMAEIDETGVETVYTYDSLKRIKTKTVKGIAAGEFPAQADLTTTYTYDALNRVVMEVLSSGSLSITNVYQFDLAGRLVVHDSPGGQTTYQYLDNGRKVVQTLPGGKTKITEKYRDGRLKSVTGSAVVGEFYDYSLPESESVTVHQYTKSMGSPRWKTTLTNNRGETFLEHRPGFSDSPNIRYASNAWWVELVGWSEYDEWRWFYHDFAHGSINSFSTFFSGWPVSSPPSGAVVAPWRESKSQSAFEKIGDDWFVVQRELGLTGDSATNFTTLKTVQTRLTGYATNEVSETIATDATGVTSWMRAVIDLAGQKITQIATNSTSTLTATNITVNGLTQLTSSFTVAAPTRFYYDDFGREIEVEGSLGFSTSKTYDPVTGWVLSQTDPATNVTSFAYYPTNHINAGLLKTRTDANGKKTYFDYNTRRQLTRTWGDVPYPQELAYNDYGELVELRTFRHGSNWNGQDWPSDPGTGDVTRWVYHEPTGLLLQKIDAQGQATSYDYFNNRKLKRKTLARGTTVNSYYTTMGDLALLSYSDGTPSVSFGDFNHAGLPKTILDAGGTNTFTFDEAARMRSHTLNGITVSNVFHAFYGRESLQAWQSGTNLLTHNYCYDSQTGRLRTVSSGDDSAEYGYVSNSDLLATTTFSRSSNTVLTTSRTYDFGFRLHSISNVLAGGSVVSAHAYDYDAVHRRTKATLGDAASWNYDYNDRNELTGAAKEWANQTPVAGQQYEYTYDNIGNRAATAEGGDANGNNLRSSIYSANALNQYISRTVPPYVDLMGTAATNATVTVNNEPVVRQEEYFWKELGLANYLNPVWAGITNVAVVNGAGSAGEDVVDEASGHKFLPQTPEAFEYDEDGNLLRDGRWEYTWDAENRLIAMETTVDAVAVGTPKRKLEFKYDFQGRRISKKVYDWNAGTWALALDQRFVRDGWNLVAVFDSQSSILQSFLWGLDLSRTMTEAGGVGGLLAFSNLQSPIETHFAAFDGNGNVMGLVNADGSGTSAIYEYSPFGQRLRMEGPAAGLNPFGFSTKFADRETGLLYYGYRYYSPTLARWLIKDPLDEEGGLNLYNFLENSPISFIDALGQNKFDPWPHDVPEAFKEIWHMMKGSGEYDLGPDGDGTPDEIRKAYRDMMEESGGDLDKALKRGGNKRNKPKRGGGRTGRTGGTLAIAGAIVYFGTGAARADGDSLAQNMHAVQIQKRQGNTAEQDLAAISATLDILAITGDWRVALFAWEMLAY